MKLYKKGVRKEYQLKHRLEKLGYFVVRSAGSHGAADLVAINPETKEIHLIQCKTYECSEKQKSIILQPLKALEGQYSVKAILY